MAVAVRRAGHRAVKSAEVTPDQGHEPQRTIWGSHRMPSLQSKCAPLLGGGIGIVDCFNCMPSTRSFSNLLYDIFCHVMYTIFATHTHDTAHSPPHTQARASSQDIHKAGPGRGYRGIMPRARTVNTVAVSSRLTVFGAECETYICSSDSSPRSISRIASRVASSGGSAPRAFSSRFSWPVVTGKSARRTCGVCKLAQIGGSQVRMADRWLLDSNGGHSLFRGLMAPPSPPGLRGDVRTCACAPASEM